MVQIEKGIEIPEPKKREVSTAYIAVARRMEVSDSVVFAEMRDAKRLGVAIRRVHGTGAATEREVVGGFRVWRIK